MNCYWHQFWIQRRLDDDRPPVRGQLRHLQACSGCREWHAGQTRLIHALRKRPVTTEEPSPYLVSRVMNEITRAPQESRSRPAIWFGTGLAGAACAGLLLFLLMPAPDPDRVARNATRPVLDSQWIEMTTRMAGGDRLFEVATNLNQPLQQEMDRVIQDARQVLKSLSHDFVPSTLLVSAE